MIAWGLLEVEQNIDEILKNMGTKVFDDRLSSFKLGIKVVSGDLEKRFWIYLLMKFRLIKKDGRLYTKVLANNFCSHQDMID